MRRALLLFVVLFAALAAPAGAHPLGNFSINHVAEVSVSADRVDVRYLLDEAEIPTFQERGPAGGRAGRAEARGGAAAPARDRGRARPCPSSRVSRSSSCARARAGSRPRASSSRSAGG